MTFLMKTQCSGQINKHQLDKERERNEDNLSELTEQTNKKLNLLRGGSVLCYYLKKKSEMRKFHMFKLCYDRLINFNNPRTSFLRACGSQDCQMDIAIGFNNCITDFFYHLFTQSLGTSKETNKGSYLAFKQTMEHVKHSLKRYFKFIQRFYLTLVNQYSSKIDKAPEY